VKRQPRSLHRDILQFRVWSQSRWVEPRRLRYISFARRPLILANDMQPNPPRRVALEDWSNQLQLARDAISTLKDICADIYIAALSGGPRSSDQTIAVDAFTACMDGPGGMLEKAKKDFAAICSSLDQIRNASRVLVPINKLPVELLKAIFIYGAETELDGHQGLISSIPPPDFTFRNNVSSVCHSWRNTCINTSRMWRYMDFRDPPPFNLSRLWINRGASYGLDIVLDFRKLDCMDQKLGLLAPHFQRCRSLTLTGDGDDSRLVTQAPRGNEMPVDNTLRGLILSSIAKDWFTTNGNLDMFWFESHQLCILDVDSVNVPWSDSRMCLMLCGLTTLHLSRPPRLTVDTLDVILRSCTNLESLYFERCYDMPERSERDSLSFESNDIPDKGPSLLPSLSNLRLEAVSPNLLRQIFSTITAPSLRTMTLDGCLRGFGDIATPGKANRRNLMRSPQMLRRKRPDF
jgi:hypothetical protein